MPRKKCDLSKYATYNSVSNKNTCLFQTCNKQLSGNSKANIKRHYKLVHKQDILTDGEFNSEDEYEKEEKYNKISEDCVLECSEYEIETKDNEKELNSTRDEDSVPESSEYERDNITLDEHCVLECSVEDTKKNIPYWTFDNQERSYSTSKKRWDIEKYVSYDYISNKSTCLIGTCKKQLSGKQKANIVRHYKLVHKLDIENKSEHVNKKEKKEETITLSITMDKGTFLKCCVGLVINQNIPFRIFDDQECFKQLIAPYEREFNINLNSTYIAAILEKSSSYIKAEIRNIVKNKMVCLKVDIASHSKTKVLCINIQYISDNKICINTIGMIQITESHNAANLKEEILRCLKEYNIEMQQIYSKTTDNGANVLNVCQLLQEMQHEYTEEEVHLDAAESSQVETFLESICSIERCTAYTIQLAANDVLKTLTSNIEECRKMVKNLCTSVSLANDQITLPYFDIVTSWNSTYDMINKLFSLKEYIEKSDSLSNSVINWPFIQNFLKAFSPLAKYTMKLQKEQYILGDFFRDWLTCELELEKLVNANPYAAALLLAMKTRKDNLLSHDAFISAIYLDPRFNFNGSPFLTSDQKKSAVEHLITVHENVHNLLNNSDEQEFLDDSSSPGSTSQNNIFPTTSEYNILDYHIQALMNAQNVSAQKRTANIKHKLLMLCERERASLDTNVLEYWYYSSDIEDDMRQIVETALAVPANQASVARLFSALPTITTKSKLSEKSLTELFITKYNYELLNLSNIDIENSLHI